MSKLLKQWNLLRRLPGGRFLFSQAIGLVVPYAGTLRAGVEELSPGLARLKMADRRGLRNHLASIHACALANLGETTAGMAVLSLEPPGARWIVTGMEVEYLKKARGTLVCECKLEGPWPGPDTAWTGLAAIRNAENEEVCRVTVHYKTGRR